MIHCVAIFRWRNLMPNWHRRRFWLDVGQMGQCDQHMITRHSTTFLYPGWYLCSLGCSVRNFSKYISEKIWWPIIFLLVILQSTIFLCKQGTHKLSFPLQSKHQTNSRYFQQFLVSTFYSWGNHVWQQKEILSWKLAFAPIFTCLISLQLIS